MRISTYCPIAIIASITALSVLGPFTSKAQTVVNALQTGTYEDGGWFMGELNTSAGRDPNPPFGFRYSRGFLVFDLTNVTTPVTSAVLRVFVETYRSAISASSQKFTVYDVTNAVSVVRSTHYKDTAALQEGHRIFDDLGEGVAFGTRDVTPADAGHTVDVTLSQEGIAALNGARGARMAMGLSLEMSTDVVYQQWIRFRNSATNGPYQLILGGTAPSVPEITSFSVNGKQATMAVANMAIGRTQEVQQCSNLALSDWSEGFHFVSASLDTNITWAISNSWERAFFRVRSR